MEYPRKYDIVLRCCSKIDVLELRLRSSSTSIFEQRNIVFHIWASLQEYEYAHIHVGKGMSLT